MRVLIGVLLLACMTVRIPAGPTTLVTIPSTDIQATHVWHFDADSTIFLGGLHAPAPIVDVGLLYGFTPHVEAGIDLVSGASDPVLFNTKILLTSPQSNLPVAVGIFNAATVQATNQSALYIVGSRRLTGVRLTLGLYQGNAVGLNAVNGSDSGLLAGLDRTDGNWWYGIDYVSGRNVLSSVNLGVQYRFAPNATMLFSFDDFQLGPNALDIQFDIDLK